MRKGSANTARGARRFIDELVARLHRAGAAGEIVMRDLKEGAGLDHVPSGNFSANSAWLQCAVLAHNLIRWTATLGQPGPVELTVAPCGWGSSAFPAAWSIEPASQPCEGQPVGPGPDGSPADSSDCVPCSRRPAEACTGGRAHCL